MLCVEGQIGLCQALILDEGPTLLQYNLILTFIDFCKDPNISYFQISSHSKVPPEVRTSTCLFLGENSIYNTKVIYVKEKLHLIVKQAKKTLFKTNGFKIVIIGKRD